MIAGEDPGRRVTDTECRAVLPPRPRGRAAVNTGDRLAETASLDERYTVGERFRPAGDVCLVTRGEGVCCVTVGDGVCRVTRGDGVERVIVGDGKCCVLSEDGVERVTVGEGVCRATVGEGVDLVILDEGVVDLAVFHDGVRTVDGLGRAAALAPV